MLTLALLTGGREHILTALAANYQWQRTKIKSPEGAASLMVLIAKAVALNEARALILPEIQGWYADFIKANGERENIVYSPTKDDWDEAHDDGVMALFEPFTSVLSASWLAFTSTDVRLWQDGEDEKLANSFAQEVWKQLTWKKTDNQILAGVGIVHDDLAQFGFMPVEPLSKPQVEYDAMSVNAIINKIMLFMPDPDELAENLDMASDDDDALALGAAERLGISMEDVEQLRVAREASHQAVKAWGNAIEAGELLSEDVVYVDLEPTKQANKALAEKLETSLDPDPIKAAGLPPLPAPPTVLKPLPPLPAGNGSKKGLPPLPGSSGTGSTVPAPAKGGRRAKNAPEPPRGYISLEILRAIKEHAGTRDEDMADMMGISRPTLANIMKGKSWYVPPDNSRREAIKAMLGKHIQALSQALRDVG